MERNTWKRGDIHKNGVRIQDQSFWFLLPSSNARARAGAGVSPNTPNHASF